MPAAAHSGGQRAARSSGGPTAGPRGAKKDAWRAAQRDAVEQARAGGDANIAFLDGRTLWPDGGEEYTVDGVHPTDLGFYFMARGLLPVLLPYLTEE